MITPGPFQASLARQRPAIGQVVAEPRETRGIHGTAQLATPT